MPIVHIWLATVLMVSLAYGVPTSQVSSSDSSNDYRLPTDIVPLSYDITLTPDMEGDNFTFVGKSVIKFEIRNTTHKIVLHMKDLELLRSQYLSCSPPRNTSVLNLSMAEDTLTIHPGVPMPIYSECTLELQYKGKDNGKNRGFYRTPYTNKDGKKKYMASTQFEPISARQVFPCFDEPAYKAIFNISIKHSRKYIALSNMPASTSHDPEDVSKIITHFGPSPKMSSYLVAFAVGEFVPVDMDKYDIQVWSREDVVNNGKYAFDVGPIVLKALENYTDYPYKKHGFFKMDSLAVPALSAGAMENWGLVIYKESGLLYDEDSYSTSQKEQVVTIMAHEMAHQWFGNLVTAKWWNDIWLNEGFANYFQYFITDQVEPTWRMMDKFVVKNLQATAFGSDCKVDSHAMVQERESNKDIAEGFDSITYSKSGSVIRMISNVLGENNFKTGLQEYLKTKASGSATSDDLFKELVKVYKNKQNLEEILKNWVTRPGYPVLNVQRNYQFENATVTQSRFFDTINVTSVDKYWIPINFVTRDNLNFNKTEITHWFDPSKESLSIDFPKTTRAATKKESFVIFNKQQYGYYRVNYDDDNWKLISDYLKTNHTNIHVLNRAQLVDDALNLAKINKLKYSIAFYLTGYLEKENDFAPWSAAWRGFEYISKVVANTDSATKFRKYVLHLSEHIVTEVLSVKLNETDHIKQQKKSEALKSACTFGSNPCRSHATEILTKWLDNINNNALLGNYEGWVMCAGVRSAPQKTWDKLWGKYLAEPSKDILNALGCTSSIEILKGYIAGVIKVNKTEDLSAVFEAIYTGSDEGVDVVLDYMIEKYKHLKAYPGYSRDQLKSDFTSLGGRLTNDKQRQKLIKFKKDADETSKDLVDGAIISVEKNLKEYTSSLEQFKTFFQDVTPGRPSSTEAPGRNSANVFTLPTIVILVSLLITHI